MVEVEKIEREREEGLKRLVVEWLATGVSRRDARDSLIAAGWDEAAANGFVSEVISESCDREQEQVESFS